MNSLRSVYSTGIQQVNYFLFLCLAASLTLPRTIVMWCWMAWLVSWFMEGRFLCDANRQGGKHMFPALFLLGWTCWEMVSLLWAQPYGGRFPDYHISLLIFPIVAYYGVNHLYDWRKISLVAIIGCVSSLFLYSFVLFWVRNYEYVFFHNIHSVLIDFQLHDFDLLLSSIKHRMLYCSALGIGLILAFMLRHDWVQAWGQVKAYLFFGFSLVCMMTAVLATGSRANILSLVAVGTIALVKQIRVRHHRYMVGTAIVMAGIGCCLLIWQFHPRMKDMTIDHVLHINDHRTDPNIQPRLLIWQCALESPKDYLVHGLGVGNVKPYMSEKFAKVNLTSFQDECYSCHCQYLDVCMELGLLAMIVFIIGWCYLPYVYPRNSRARQYGLYLNILFGLNMLTDDNLSRLETIIYLCFSLILMDLMAKSSDTPAAVA